MQTAAAPVELTQEHLRRLRADDLLYCRGALAIQTKDGRLVPFEPNFAQRLVAERIAEQKARTGRVRVLILKARQEGISTFCAARIFHGCTLFSHRRGLVMADKLDRAGEIFGIYERFYRELAAPLRPALKNRLSRRELAFSTDSRITVETAGDPDAGRGATIHRMHASELAFWPRADETWTALMQAVPSEDSEVYVESTAKGIGNLFHRLWLLAESGDSEWLPLFLPWWIHDEYQRRPDDDERVGITQTSDPWERKALDEGIEWEGNKHRLSVNQLAWRRGKIRDDFLGDERTFRQEYPATAREAFVTSGDGFFDADALEEYDARAHAAKARGTFVWDKRVKGYRLQHSQRGYVRIWELPDKDGHYVLGADTAEGKRAAASDASLVDAEAERGGRDFSVAEIVKVSELEPDPDKPGTMRRVGCMRQVAEVHGRMAPEVFAEQVDAASKFWSCPKPGMKTSRRACLVGVERNHSSGQTVLSLLRDRHHHSDIFIHRRMNVRGGKVTSWVGWVTDGTTRMPMLDGLAAFVREGTIGIASGDIVREMFSFVRGDDGKPQAQEGAHDDRVMALGIAVQMSVHHHDTPAGKFVEPVVSNSPTGMGYI